MPNPLVLGLQGASAIGSLWAGYQAADESGRQWQEAERQNRRLRRDIASRHETAYGDIVPQYQEHLGTIPAGYEQLATGYETLSDNMMSRLEGFGTQARSDIHQQGRMNEAQAMAGLYSRGMSGSTRAGTTGAVVEQGTQSQLAQLSDQLSRQRVSMYMGGQQAALGARQQGLNVSEQMMGNLTALKQNLNAAQIRSLENINIEYPRQTGAGIRAQSWGGLGETFANIGNSLANQRVRSAAG